MGGDGGVALVGPLLANLPNDPLDRFRSDFQIRQFGEITGPLLIGGTVDTGVDNFLLHPWAETGAVNSQCLILREKKPSDSGGNYRPVVSRPRLLAWS